MNERERGRERKLLTRRKVERTNVCYINIIIHIFTCKVTIASLVVIESNGTNCCACNLKLKKYFIPLIPEIV